MARCRAHGHVTIARDSPRIEPLELTGCVHMQVQTARIEVRAQDRVWSQYPHGPVLGLSLRDRSLKRKAGVRLQPGAVEAIPHGLNFRLVHTTTIPGVLERCAYVAVRDSLPCLEHQATDRPSVAL